MIFNSLSYAIFLPIVLVAYFALSHRWQNRMLLAASYLFYGWWDERFLFLIVASTAMDYSAALFIDRGKMTGAQRASASAHLLGGAFLFLVFDWSALQFGAQAPFVSVDTSRIFVRGWMGWPAFLGTAVFLAVVNYGYRYLVALPDARRRKVAITLSVCGNLGMLGVFKYFDFFIGSAEDLVRSLGLEASYLRLDILLPVGISFYTFQTMSYTIDVYRRRLVAVESYRDFALFVAYFPQLVAGPIERATNLLPSIQKPRNVTLADFSDGTFFVLRGLFKKIAIADGVAGAVSSVFNSTGTPTWGDVTVGSFLFCLQVYGDFSGYSDIAIGSSRFMGIPLMTNFKLPLFAASPSEFFQRWHISLSSWLKDYVYIALGGSRFGNLRMYRNLFLTMLIGGLWHGAAWTFVVWGAYEGLLIVVDRLLTRGQAVRVDPHPGFSALVRRLPFILGYNFIHLFSWMTFRSPTWTRFLELSGVLFTGSGGLHLTMSSPTTSALIGIPLLLWMEALEYCAGSRWQEHRLPAPMRGLVSACLILLTTMGLANASKQFIYFQF